MVAAKAAAAAEMSLRSGRAILASSCSSCPFTGSLRRLKAWAGQLDATGVWVATFATVEVWQVATAASETVGSEGRDVYAGRCSGTVSSGEMAFCAMRWTGAAAVAASIATSRLRRTDS